MKNKKVTVIIEASSTGFGAYAEALPGITGYGVNVQQAKKDLQDGLRSRWKRLR